VKQAENEARKSMVEDEPRQRAKKQMMVLLQAGQPWQEAAQIAGVQTSRSTAYRWLQQFRTTSEKRPCTMGGTGTSPRCASPSRSGWKPGVGRRPSLPSSSLQKELNTHFAVLVSITHLHRIRAAHGMVRQPAQMGKKSRPKLNS